MATNGLVLIKPSSVAKTGASSTATINAGGSVTFGLCETLSLNGVFSSAYDNYIISWRGVEGGTNNIRGRLRSTGTDDSTANSYVLQYVQASGTTISGGRITTNWASLNVGSTVHGGFVAYVYGPYLVQPTAIRTVTADGFGSARISDFASTHNQSTAYDGFTFLIESGSSSGLVKVYGLVK